eukprot:5496711-Pyramimonas_sp.AAC.1
MSRPAKLRKLNDFRYSLPHASQVALAAFLRKAKYGDLPDLSRAADVRDARGAACNANTPCGPLTQEAQMIPKKGGPFTVEVANMNCYLHVASQRTLFANLIKETYARDPCSISKPGKV